jgi:hypothetical protein
MAGSSLLFFDLPLSRIRLQFRIYTSSLLEMSLSTPRNIIKIYNNLYRALE